MLFLNSVMAFSYEKGIEILMKIAPYAEAYFNIGVITHLCLCTSTILFVGVKALIRELSR